MAMHLSRNDIRQDIETLLRRRRDIAADESFLAILRATHGRWSTRTAKRKRASARKGQ
jgi:hypothetical protein